MPPHSLFAMDFSSGTTLLAALGIGLGAAALVYVVGRFLTMPRGQNLDDHTYNLDPRPETSEEEEVDVFTQGTTQDRRRALRRGGNPVAVLVSDAHTKTAPVPGYVLDRSTGGLCLSVSDEIPAGTVLSVRTANAPQTIPWIQVEVRNCRPVGKEYELGCKFIRTPPWSVLLLFG